MRKRENNTEKERETVKKHKREREQDKKREGTDRQTDGWTERRAVKEGVSYSPSIMGSMTVESSFWLSSCL